MDRLLGRHFWGGLVVVYLAVVSWLNQTIADTLGPVVKPLYSLLKNVPVIRDRLPDELTPLEIAAFGFGILLFILFSNWVWRFACRIPLLKGLFKAAIFPDLNGEWKVEAKSNWPMIEKTLKAAKDGTIYDATAIEAPEFLAVETMTATIEQSWRKVLMTIVPDNTNSKIERSFTVAFDLMRKDEKGHHKLAYVYEQVTRDDNRAENDEKDFLGAALLTVSKDENSLEGHYFTNRNWTKGLNTAGTIKLTRKT